MQNVPVEQIFSTECERPPTFVFNSYVYIYVYIVLLYTVT